MKKLQEARENDLESFKYTNKDNVTKTYKRKATKTGMFVYKAVAK